MIVIREGQEPVQIRSGFEPFAVTLITACLLWSGTSLAALSKIASTTTRSLPAWSVYVFFTAMVLGTATMLTGVVLERVKASLLGVYVERAGLTGLMGLCLTYSVWVWTATGVRGLGFVYLMGAVWVGAAWRNILIWRDLRTLKRGSP